MLNNNVGSTTLLHPVFNNLEQVIIFTCVYETKGYSKSRVAGNHHHKAKGEGHRKIDNWGVPIFIYSCSAQLILTLSKCVFYHAHGNWK